MPAPIGIASHRCRRGAARAGGDQGVVLLPGRLLNERRQASHGRVHEGEAAPGLVTRAAALVKGSVSVHLCENVAQSA
jgi:hypothetical protein